MMTHAWPNFAMTQSSCRYHAHTHTPAQTQRVTLPTVPLFRQLANDVGACISPYKYIHTYIHGPIHPPIPAARVASHLFNQSVSHPFHPPPTLGKTNQQNIA